MGGKLLGGEYKVRLLKGTFLLSSCFERVRGYPRRMPSTKRGGRVGSQKQTAADKGEGVSQMWLSELKIVFVFYYLEILFVQYKFNV